MTPYQKIEKAILDKGGRFINAVKFGDGSRLEMWIAGGRSLILQVFTDGRYQLYAPPHGSIKVADDIKFIESLQWEDMLPEPEPDNITITLHNLKETETTLRLTGALLGCGPSVVQFIVEKADKHDIDLPDAIDYLQGQEFAVTDDSILGELQRVLVQRAENRMEHVLECNEDIPEPGIPLKLIHAKHYIANVQGTASTLVVNEDAIIESFGDRLGNAALEEFDNW